MGAMYDDIYEEAGSHAFEGVWAATIAHTVGSMSAMAYVTIPAFGDEEWGPCRWQSRDSSTKPQAGDPCVVVFDSDRQPWVVAWWPF